MTASDMRDQILQVASELIRRNGPAGATARTICKIIGVTAPTLYHYYSDMETLREEVVNRAFEKILEVSNAGWASGHGVDGLKRSWDAFLAFANDEPAMFSILANRTMNGPMPKIAIESLAKFEDTLSGPEFAGRLTQPSKTAAHILWSAAQGAGVLLLAKQSGLALSADIGDDIFNTVMSSLMPATPQAP
ncbi:TetR/AcrR family transcriptional regulator [Novosphingobium sp. PASSN1]|uniref:TetR/AcrR family transcriptional regulator n=1 Tax=Novosphingobium sp. PASSN1 TaxID=2015561 RepID=UPI0025DB9753|nr:TetR/AcrR family transcriptional regulator [Novosphingobium sp. PASSN1]